MCVCMKAVISNQTMYTVMLRLVFAFDTIQMQISEHSSII